MKFGINAKNMARGIVAIAMLGAACVANAFDFKWDGASYIPLGMQLRSDLILRMPEDVDGYWGEEQGAFTVQEVDGRTLSLRPRTDKTDQRFFIVGKVTRTVYIAHMSSDLKYYPIVNVLNAPSETLAMVKAAKAMSPLGLIRSMMRSEPPAGFQVSPSARVILNAAPYKLTAKAVWSSPEMTGVVVQITKNTQAREVKFVPENLQISIPEFGDLRVIAADRWDLNTDQPTTNSYFVFTR